MRNAKRLGLKVTFAAPILGFERAVCPPVTHGMSCNSSRQAGGTGTHRQAAILVTTVAKVWNRPPIHTLAAKHDKEGHFT
jgi:hypothetical protein